MKKLRLFLVCGLIAVLSLSTLTGCAATTGVNAAPSGANTAATGVSVTANEPVNAAADPTAIAASAAILDPVAEAALAVGWDSASAVKIKLKGTAIDVDGAGAQADKNVVTITAPGIYEISGILSDGQIVVAATKDDKIQLVLNGADITNKSGAAIYASQCDRLTVTLAAGTQNQVTDGGSNFTYANADEEPNAAIFSKDDLTINGTGALTVNAGFNNGIGTKDDLRIEGGNFTVTAANHGLRGNDSVTITAGSFAISAGNDGIQTNNEEDAAKGSIVIAGGVFKIAAAHDAIQSENQLTISGGKFDLVSGGGAATVQTASAAATSDSYKGLKAVSDVTITAGIFAIDSADDSIHSNGNITISDGDFTLSSGDDGIHADSALKVSGGRIAVVKSYEGLEAANINISAGAITAIASDDGINAAGGRDAQVGGGRFGSDTFTAGNSYDITISGGEITVYSGSDGIDSNGTLNVTGGTVAVFINAPRDGEATDVDRGGTISPALYVSAAVKAGTKLTVGNLWSLTPIADATSFCLILPGLVSGQAYPITADGAALATVTATTTIPSLGMGGGFGGGPGGQGGLGGQNGSGAPGGHGQRPAGDFGGERPAGEPPAGGQRTNRGEAPPQF
jgi:hypothetical protein